MRITRRGLRRAATSARRHALESLEPRHLLAGDVIISEFLALNSGRAGALVDEDGDSSDWIELQNASLAPVDLAGWHLTDDAADLAKWTLPSRNLAPGARLVVFASGKDRGAAQLHTNFELDGGGEYLAVVEPDGVTVSSEFAPTFPSQESDVSFGVLDGVRTTHSLVTADTVVRALVPSDSALGSSWTMADFNDTSWPASAAGAQGTQALGFDTSVTPPAPGPYITSISRGGTSANPAPVLVPGGLAEDVDSYNDRTHEYNGVDATNTIVALGLAGADFVRPANNDRATADFSLTLNLNGIVDLYLFIDDRVGDNVNTTPPTLGTVMPWVASLGFVDTGLNIGIDENGDGVGPGASIQNFASIYKKSGVSGSITLGAQNDTTTGGPGGRNMYGVAALRPAGGASLFLPEIDTNLQSQMLGRNASVYLRAPFGFSGGGDVEQLLLRTRYDDGFVAYLNGVEVARLNAPGIANTPLDSAAAATTSRANAQALVYEEIDLTAYRDLLLNGGANVLAVQALNSAANDPDFLFQAELTATTFVADNQTQYFTTPTPGAANQPGVFGFVADTKFDGDPNAPGVFHDAGFYDAPFDVTLSTETEGAEIRYTTNGTPPTATTGTLYTAPIHIAGTTTLRVAAFKPGYQSTNVDTQTYIFPTQVLQQTGAGLPPLATWGHAGPDWAVDPDIVNAASAADRVVADDLKAIPTVSLALPFADMWGTGGQGIYIAGAGVERGTSIEMIQPDGTPGFSINGSVEIQGGTSDDRWKDDKLSMQLKFHRPYGPTKLNYDIFGEGAAAAGVVDESATDSFDTLILDGVLNWSWVHTTDATQRAGAKYIQDQWVADLQNAAGGFSPHGRYVHLYINGLYWGMYYLHERPDKTFNSDYQGGDKDEWNVIKHNGGTIVDSALTNPPGVTASTDYNQLLSLAGADLANESNYQAVAARLDVDAFVDYLLINWYAGNQDWPAKNWYASRQASPEGKWRFHSWDAEHVLRAEGATNAVDINYVGRSPSDLHARLMLNDGYRQRFGDRAQRMLFGDGVLTPTRAAALYQARMAEVDKAIRGESARWGDNSDATPRTRSQWLATQNALLTSYFPNRTAVFLAQLRSAGLYPAINAPQFSSSGGEVPAGYPLAIADTNSPAGTVYYTTDGSDPRTATSAVTTVLLPERSPARALVPSVANGGSVLGTTWIQPGFADGAWTSGNAGVGYDRGAATTPDYLPLIGINVQSQMDNINGSVYVRTKFNVFDREAFDSLTLKMKYDDGFVAYLNGFEVARSFAPAGTPAWNSTSNGGNSDANAIVFQNFDISAHLNRLVDGENVLAIHGLNNGIGSSDMLILPEVVAATTIGSGISPTALAYSAPVPIAETETVKARVLRGTTWSALASASFAVDVPVRVSEIYYNPPGASEATEFVELANVGASPVDLTGVRFTEGIDYEFLSTDANHTLAPGGRLVIVHDLAAFQAAYPHVPASVIADRAFVGNLDNGGEQVTLVDAGGAVIQSFSYDDAWHPSTDGDGYSLVRLDPAGLKADWNLASAWRASYELAGSPGEVDRLRGDFDGDLTVSLVDLAILQSHLGTPSGAGYGDGDMNRDGAVDRDDAALFAARFGRSIALPDADLPVAAAPSAIVAARDANAASRSGMAAVAAARPRVRRSLSPPAADAALSTLSVRRPRH